MIFCVWRYLHLKNMNNKFIIFPNQTTISILHTNQQGDIEKIAKKDIPKNVAYKIVNNLNFLDLEFLGAYEFDSEHGAKINIEKAKFIFLNKFREARTPLLQKLDLEYMKADESGDLELKKQIAAKKQALRDVTKTELPNTLEGIKSTWPDILK